MSKVGARTRLFRRLQVTSLILGFLLLSPAAPGGAIAKNPVLHRGSCAGACWSSYVVRTDGAEMEFEIVAKNLRLPLQLAVFVYDANSGALGDKLVFSFPLLLMDVDDGAFLNSSVPRNPVVHVDTRALQSTRNSVSLTVTMNDDDGQQDLIGRYRVLMWSAGAVGETEYATHGKPGSQYLGHDAGNDTFLYTSSDFRGPLNAQAGNGLVEGRVNHDLRLGLDVENTMVANFATVDGQPSALDSLRAQTPKGLVDCPCFFSTFTQQFQNLPPAGPGRYTFYIDGADLDSGNASEIIVAGADAQLAAQTIPG